MRVFWYCNPHIFSLFSLVSQALTLTKKIRTKWGDFNGTDADDSDTPNWGFLNMKKLGHIAIGIAKEELRDLPIRGVEDVIDVLGQEKDWDRGQVSVSQPPASATEEYCSVCVTVYCLVQHGSNVFGGRNPSV